MENSLIGEILIENFKNFYYEILKQKEIALRSSHSNENLESESSKLKSDEKKNKEDINELNLDSSLKNDLSQEVIKKFTLIQEKISSFIEDESFYSKLILSNYDFEQIFEAKYLMVSFADEIFLKLEWLGRDLWKNNLLETKHFQTQIAGEEIFKRVDSLLIENSKRKSCLALLYFYIISLDFGGKYDSNFHKEILKNYLRKLFIFIKDENPDHSQNEKIFKDCYSNNLSKIVNEKLPDVNFWTRIIISILLLYCFFTYFVWYKSASEIRSGTEFIIKSAKKLQK